MTNPPGYPSHQLPASPVPPTPLTPLTTPQRGISKVISGAVLPLPARLPLSLVPDSLVLADLSQVLYISPECEIYRVALDQNDNLYTTQRLSGVLEEAYFWQSITEEEARTILRHNNTPYRGETSTLNHPNPNSFNAAQSHQLALAPVERVKTGFELVIDKIFGVALAVIGVAIVVLVIHLLQPKSETSSPQIFRVEGDGANPKLVAVVGKISNAADYRPLNQASITKENFTGFLQQNSSPATSEAGEMYQVLIENQIDPAIALGFFWQESSLGKLGVANTTKSLGNIRCSAGYQCYQTKGNGSFRKYATWTEGAGDWGKLMQYYRDKLKLNMLEEIIPVYAPSADNNYPAGYIKAVRELADRVRKEANKLVSGR